jgi:quercetin dioxygenase-like cupin family protein
MSKKDTPMNTKNNVLSEEDLMLLSDAPSAIDDVDTNSVRMQSLRSNIMARVDEQQSNVPDDMLTIRADTGDWEDISDKIRKKVLHVDEQNGIETYLLKIEAGAKDAPHIHTSDEHCIVLEGDVCFGEIHLNAGDYHLAPKGSRHEEAYSVHGALLYIQTGLEKPLPM